MESLILVPAMYRAILICQDGVGVRTDIVVRMEGVRWGLRVLGGDGGC